MIEIGTRVSYEDMANPLREGTIVGDVAGQWAVKWDEDEAIYNLVEVDGVRFHTTVTKHMLENATTRQTTFRDEGRGHRCGGWDVLVDDGADAIEWLSNTNGSTPEQDEALDDTTTTFSDPKVLVQSTIERQRECVECRRAIIGGERFVHRLATRTIRKPGERTRVVKVGIVTHLRACTSDAVLDAIVDENVDRHALNTLDNERARRARVNHQARIDAKDAHVERIYDSMREVGGAFDGVTVTSDADNGL